MKPLRSVSALLFSAALLLGATASAKAQEDEAVFLVANPGLRDLEYRQAVVIAVREPAAGGHVGVIINRPTRRSMGSLFPDHEPSKKVADPVYVGGPFSRSAVVALVKTDVSPGGGSIPVMKNLFLTARANTIDRIIESAPNSARFYVGMILWRPGELKQEIDRGVWAVLDPDVETVFRGERGMEGVWEEMIQVTKRIRTEAPADPLDPDRTESAAVSAE